MNATSKARKESRLEAIKSQGHSDAHAACDDNLFQFAQYPDPDGSYPEVTAEKLEEFAATPDGGWDSWLINSGEFHAVAGCEWDREIEWAVESALAYHAGASAGAAEWLAEKLAELGD